MRRVAVAIATVAFVVVVSAVATAQPASRSPKMTCDLRSIPVRYASVETTCAVENFPPNAVVTFFAAFTATTDAAGRARATFRIPCCFEEPGALRITATAPDGTTASTTVTVVANAPEPVRGRATFTG